jgi:hypothetical protein
MKIEKGILIGNYNKINYFYHLLLALYYLLFPLTGGTQENKLCLQKGRQRPPLGEREANYY